MPAARSRVASACSRRAQVRAHAGQQLLDRERLGDVVRGARVEARDLVGDLGAGGEHDHRQRRLDPADLLEDVDPVAAGQHHVEDHEVGIARERAVLALGPSPATSTACPCARSARSTKSAMPRSSSTRRIRTGPIVRRALAGLDERTLTRSLDYTDPPCRQWSHGPSGTRTCAGPRRRRPARPRAAAAAPHRPPSSRRWPRSSAAGVSALAAATAARARRKPTRARRRGRAATRPSSPARAPAPPAPSPPASRAAAAPQPPAAAPPPAPATAAAGAQPRPRSPPAAHERGVRRRPRCRRSAPPRSWWSRSPRVREAERLLARRARRDRPRVQPLPPRLRADAGQRRRRARHARSAGCSRAVRRRAARRRADGRRRRSRRSRRRSSRWATTATSPRWPADAADAVARRRRGRLAKRELDAAAPAAAARARAAASISARRPRRSPPTAPPRPSPPRRARRRSSTSAATSRPPGRSRPGGWVGPRDRRPPRRARGADGQRVTVRGGGLATSSTTVRRWRRAGRDVHHIVDPAHRRARRAGVADRQRRRGLVRGRQHGEHRRDRARSVRAAVARVARPARRGWSTRTGAS